jgi:hypothetical protein
MADHLGAVFGSAQANASILWWDRPGSMRRMVFWTVLSACITIVLLNAYLYELPIEYIVCSLIGSLGTAWVIGWLTEFASVAQKNRLTGLCRTSAAYQKCTQDGTLGSGVCDTAAGVADCVRTLQILT